MFGYDDWVPVERPGRTGFEKARIEAERNQKYGKGYWKVGWVWEGSLVDKLKAYQICEEAYFEDSFRSEDRWKELATAAKDVYDFTPEDIKSGTDYLIQGEFARFHDIAIRRILQRRGWSFAGKNIIQIRYGQGGDPVASEYFDPLKVPFHLPSKIERPLLEGAWDANSVECFYQSNKVLLRRI